MTLDSLFDRYKVIDLFRNRVLIPRDSLLIKQIHSGFAQTFLPFEEEALSLNLASGFRIFCCGWKDGFEPTHFVIHFYSEHCSLNFFPNPSCSLLRFLKISAQFGEFPMSTLILGKRASSELLPICWECQKSLLLYVVLSFHVPKYTHFLTHSSVAILFVFWRHVFFGRCFLAMNGFDTSLAARDSHKSTRKFPWIICFSSNYTNFS